MPEKILDFFAMYAVQKADGIFLKDLSASYDGLILGLSHAYFGIDPAQLSGNWCSLAIPSQDIYYHLCSTAYCLEKYRENLTGLKHVIIDMYDYINFNWDVSLSRMILQYYAKGGFCLDLHHYHENGNFPSDIQYAMLQNSCYFPQSPQTGRDLKALLFDEDKVMAGFQSAYGNAEYSFYRQAPLSDMIRSCIPSRMAVDENFFHTTLFQRQFPLTISRNRSSLRSLFDLLLSFNPKMRIDAILIPRFITYEKEAARLAHMQNWKNSFENVMNEMLRDYPIRLHDLKNLETISECHTYYLDGCHLNAAGRNAFTRYLNGLLEPVS